MIQVTCALIINPKNQKEVLAVQRSEQMPHPLKWEFPGGKIEANEIAEACIVREIQEELACQIEVVKTLSPQEHHYPNVSVCLHPFIVRWTYGELQLLEHKRAEFFSKEGLLKLDWLDADVPIVHEFITSYLREKL